MDPAVSHHHHHPYPHHQQQQNAHHLHSQSQQLPSLPAANSTAAPSAAADQGTREIKRRAPIACKRCRRARSKCIHQKRPPCTACRDAGYGPEDCIFPVRGQPDDDRDFRHPRKKVATKKTSNKQDYVKPSPKVPNTPTGPTAPSIDWDDLPPLEELIDGVNRFTKYYFQLGFIPKKQFPDRIRRDHRSVNLFLLLSILSISARLSPFLTVRFGTGVKASEFFMEWAAIMAKDEYEKEPTLERCQAYYLLSIAQQGSGLRNMSYLNMGTATRMAFLMQLHREETYVFTGLVTPDLIIRAESARRTIWMLHSQDSLHSCPSSPVSIVAADITALLPCDEEDFAAGRLPARRAALADTWPARENPSLVTDPERSLFASLMQGHYIWGLVSRKAANFTKSLDPWKEGSDSYVMRTRLSSFEKSLPHEHTFSSAMLKQHKNKGQDLAYLSVTMMIRLCNIVVRRPYLCDMLQKDNKAPSERMFFSNLSVELFTNVHQLFIQVEAQFTDRGPDERVGAQIAAFCVYSCGLFAAYLYKYPQICPEPALTSRGQQMVTRILVILDECKKVWPLASRWVDNLEKFLRDPQQATESSMADGQDPIPHALRTSPQEALSPASPGAGTAQQSSTEHSSPQSSYQHTLTTAPTSQASQEEEQLVSPFSSFSSQPPPAPMPMPFTHHHQPPPPYPMPLPQAQMYMQPTIQRPNGVNMLIEAFDPAHPNAAGPPPVAYEMDGLPVPPGTQGAYYNDGYEHELEYYMGGAVNWIPQAAAAWSHEYGGMHHG